MLNQGDIVGNTKGLDVSMTQNGEMLPCGTPDFIVGIAAPATTSLLSGTAFAANLGAAQTKTSSVSFEYIWSDQILFIWPNIIIYTIFQSATSHVL